MHGVKSNDMGMRRQMFFKCFDLRRFYRGLAGNNSAGFGIAGVGRYYLLQLFGLYGVDHQVGALYYLFPASQYFYIKGFKFFFQPFAVLG